MIIRTGCVAVIPLTVSATTIHVRQDDGAAESSREQQEEAST